MKINNSRLNFIFLEALTMLVNNTLSRFLNNSKHYFILCSFHQISMDSQSIVSINRILINRNKILHFFLILFFFFFFILLILKSFEIFLKHFIIFYFRVFCFELIYFCIINIKETDASIIV